MSFGPSGINSPPEGGEQPPFGHPSVACALRLRRPARRLGRLHGGGRFPRPPWGGQARPRMAWTAYAAPHPSADQWGRARRSRAGRRPEGFQLRGNFLKRWAVRMHGGEFGGVPPGAVERWATGLSRWAVSGQRAALSTPSTGDPGCPRRNGPQGAVFGRASEKTCVFPREPRKAVFPGVRKFQRTLCSFSPINCRKWEIHCIISASIIGKGLPK